MAAVQAPGPLARVAEVAQAEQCTPATQRSALQLLHTGPQAGTSRPAKCTCCLQRSTAAVETTGSITDKRQPADNPRQPPPPSSTSSSSKDCPPWPSLPAELVASVVKATGSDPLFALIVSQVCTSWRTAVNQDRSLLQGLCFRGLKLRPHAPLSASLQLPLLLEQAIACGSLRAALVAARHMDTAACRLARTSPRQASAALEAGARYWQKAAKLGHPEAQWRIGFANFKGLMGLHQDSEQALMWLTRACRQLQELGVEEAGAAPEAARLPLMLTAADCRNILAQAAHAAAWLHWDGEACKQDMAVAIRHFRLAAACGCDQAQRTLGSLLKSGQYA